MGSGRAATAAAIIRECRQALRVRGGVGREVLGERARGVAEDWRHYPPGDGYDPASHSQYFYHRHPGGETGEHGHFHLFLRAEGMPEDMLPFLLPEAAIANLPTPPQAAPSKRGSRDEVSHLVAIAVDGDGEPVRLFTTNRWVTAETWYRADDVIRMLDRFTLDAGEPAGLVNAWLGAMVRLYQPEIAMLLRERDRTVMERRQRRRVDVFEDPRLEVTGLQPDDRSRSAARGGRPARGGHGVHAPQRLTPSRLPRMAEGWGS